jgi:5-methylcytosine-specific restriction protein A
MAEMTETTYTSLWPARKENVYSILNRLGHDLKDWNNIKGGASRAPSNPKYCYNWSFENPGKVFAVCIWYAEISHDESSLFHANNLRGEPMNHSIVSRNIRKRRAGVVDNHVQSAYLNQLPIDAILLAGTRLDRTDPSSQASRVRRRQLDTVQWAVTEYDFDSGDFLLTRGAKPVVPFAETIDPEVASFNEGAARRAFRNHRYRERKARLAKLEQAKSKNGGRLICEVQDCGFDFLDCYGPIGEGYAQVHHLEPLSDAPRDGRPVTLDKLAVVCANCHAMIHIGGECRALAGLIQSR